MNPENEGAALETSILDYLAANPAAQDTLDGIVDWWLLRERVAQSMADVEAALARLVERNLVTKHEGADGRVHYRAAPRSKKAR